VGGAGVGDAGEGAGEGDAGEGDAGEGDAGEGAGEGAGDAGAGDAGVGDAFARAAAFAAARASRVAARACSRALSRARACTSAIESGPPLTATRIVHPARFSSSVSASSSARRTSVARLGAWEPLELGGSAPELEGGGLESAAPEPSRASRAVSAAPRPGALARDPEAAASLAASSCVRSRASPLVPVPVPVPAPFPPWPLIVPSCEAPPRSRRGWSRGTSRRS
jgi:hypothetical protein